MAPLESKIRGGLWGLLVGDALGVPYEFKKADQIPPPSQIEFVPPPGYPRTYPSVAPGTWSDDGAQALALLDSLLENGRLDIEDLAARLSDWQTTGKYAVGGVVFDIGITTARALDKYRNGVPAALCGPRDESANGNGALMRVLPLVLWHRGGDEELIQLAMEQSLPTHGHLRSGICCALYCLWARRILHGDATPWESATQILREYLADSQAGSEQLEFHIRPDDFRAGNGSGYVVDCLISARWAMRETSFESVVKNAVALGCDTDTTACVAGGVAGIRDGFEAIPKRWIEELRERALVEQLSERLLSWHRA